MLTPILLPAESAPVTLIFFPAARITFAFAGEGVAGIVLFNPDINRLLENIGALVPQIDSIILVDNHSENIEEVKSTIFDDKHSFSDVSFKLIENPANLGIATALNIICREALLQGAEWVLTMDQDSVCSSDLIDIYTKYINYPGVASLTCVINDRSGSLEYEKEKWNDEFRDVNFAITSANYIKLSVWQSIGGFDDRFFIDKVDTDYCFRLIEANYRILEINYSGMLHEIGQGATDHKLFGYPFVVFNHSPFRAYYIVRNHIVFARKYESLKGKKWARRVKRTAWTRVIVYLLYEKQKIKKVKAWIRGLIDGYRFKF